MQTNPIQSNPYQNYPTEEHEETSMIVQMDYVQES